MGLINWQRQKVKQMGIFDYQMVKICSAAVALMVAKLWSPLLSLEWYWYLVIALVAMMKPLCKFCRSCTVRK